MKEFHPEGKVPNAAPPRDTARRVRGWARDLAVLVRAGWLPWWMRWPVMLGQLACLPVALLVEFAWMVWADGVRSALVDGWDGLRDMPGNFADCWTGKRRLW